MNVVFLVSLNKGFGGGDYSMYKFAEAFAGLGHRVSLFYLGNKGLITGKPSAQFKIYRKFSLGIKFKGSGLINNQIARLYDLCYLNPFLKKNKIDFIIGYQTETAVKAISLGKKYNIKTVTFTFETPDWLMEKWPAWKTMYATNARLREIWEEYKMVLKASDLIIANSHLTALETKKWTGRQPDLVMYPGITAGKTTPGNTSKEKQIIYVGRLEENKNIHEIIEALATLNAGVKLVVCGTGDAKEALVKLAKATQVHVEFKGAVSDDEKWTEIKKSLFMVFPSSFEGFGMPPMEALFMGIPCICSGIPVLYEVYGNYVEYFEEHNVTDLAGKINKLLQDPGYTKQRGEAGHAFVSSQFGWARSAGQLELKLTGRIASNN